MSDDLASFEDRLTDCLRDLSASETQAHLQGKWSVQQIVEHLMLTYSATVDVVESRIAKGRPTQAKPSLMQRCGQVYVMHLGYFPRGVRAPEAVVPPTGLVAETGDELAARAVERLWQMDAVLAEASLLFGDRKRSVSHIILGPLSLAQWRRFHVVHGLHHISQIQATRGAKLAAV